MTDNDHEVRNLIEAMKTITAHAETAEQRLKNWGAGGGAVGGTTKIDFRRHTRLAVKSLEACAVQVDQISARLEEVIPIQDLRRTLGNMKLRDTMPPDVRAAWNRLSVLLEDSPSEIVEKAS